MDDQRAIFSAYHTRLRRFFESRGLSEDEARDLTQETFVRVFQNMDQLRSQAAVESWILRIAANLWKNEIRYHKAAKRDVQEISLDDADCDREAIERAALQPESFLGPLDEVLASERLAAVKGCLDALPPRMRQCLVLHVFQGHRYREVAGLLQISIESVKSHIHQAREHLKDCVARRLAEKEP